MFLRVSYAGLRPLESSPDDRRRALSDPGCVTASFLWPLGQL